MKMDEYQNTFVDVDLEFDATENPEMFCFPPTLCLTFTNIAKVFTASCKIKRTKEFL